MSDHHADIDAMKTCAEALEKLPRWRQALALAYLVDRFVDHPAAESVWEAASELRAKEHGDDPT